MTEVRLCVTCCYFQESIVMNDPPRCGHSAAAQGVDYVTGSPRGNTFCRDMRDGPVDETPCGEGGLLWQRRSEKS